jgi:CRISPR-associated protein Cas8a1/Csx13
MEAELNQHTWKVSDPGMDLLERAGLAGLRMALQAASEARLDLPPLEWSEADVTEDSVTVRWRGPARAAFQKLIEWAWQAPDGVLYFPAVHGGLDASNWHLRVPMHSGLMRTFLQHTNVQPKGAPTTRVVTLDDDKQIAVTYQPPVIRQPKPRVAKDGEPGTQAAKPRTSGPPKLLKPHKDVDELFDRQGGFKAETVELSNWVYPGIAGRFGGEGSWCGRADRALLLMLAPTVCLFMRLQGTGGNWVVAVPDVRDLADFARKRSRLHLAPEFVDVASLGDAGLRFLAAFSTQEPRLELKAGCRVIAMGYVTYYANQSVRKGVLDVPPRALSVRRYRRLHGVFPNHFQRRKVLPPGQEAGKGRRKKAAPAADVPQGNGWYKLPTGRGRIADNLVAGRPWYRDLFVPLPWDEQELEDLRRFFKARDNKSYSRETTWFRALSLQRSKLMRLIAEDDMWDSEAEKVFVQVVWETLDSLYAQEWKAVERGGSATYEKRCERLNGEIYRSLVQAKTPLLLRSVLSALFARAGRQKTIFAHHPAVWRLIDHPEHWQKGRDLGLLAFASYRRRAVREGKETDTESPDLEPQGAAQ